MSRKIADTRCAGAVGKGFSAAAAEFLSLALKGKRRPRRRPWSKSPSGSLKKASKLAKDVVLAFNKTSAEQADSIAQITGELSRIDQVIRSNSFAAGQSAAASVELPPMRPC